MKKIIACLAAVMISVSSASAAIVNFTGLDATDLSALTPVDNILADSSTGTFLASPESMRCFAIGSPTVNELTKWLTLVMWAANSWF